MSHPIPHSRRRLLLPALLQLVLCTACREATSPASPHGGGETAAPAQTSGTVDPEVAALLEDAAAVPLPSEDEARGLADQSIDAQNADAEFARLKAEIEADGN